MKLGATESIKFKKLKMKLRLSHWEAVGLLESIWLFTSRNAPLGDIGRHPDEDICAAIEWSGNPLDLMSALSECRWLDVSPEHRLIVHDWSDHMPTWLSGNLARHGKTAVDRQVAKKQSTQVAEQSTKQPCIDSAKQQSTQAADHETRSTTIPSHSIPSQVIPPQSMQDVVVVPDSENPKTSNGYHPNEKTFLSTGDEQFQELWQIVPASLRSGIEGVWIAYQHRRFELSLEMKTTELVAGIRLKERYRAYLASPKGRKKTHRWSVKTWFEEKHDTDDDAAWQIESQDSAVEDEVMAILDRKAVAKNGSR